MEVPALSIRLLKAVLVLLVAQVDCSYFAKKMDEAFPRVVPDRLQFLEYENFSVRCEEIDDFTGWRVMRKLIKINTTNSFKWNTSEPSVSIQLPFERDSGEYWCENEEGDRSNTLNISVTAGSVILEIPAHPVMEGNNVTLHCRNKKTESQHIADFYKDGSHLRTLYNSSLIIQNVSKSDEGLYKCSISGAGESPESWLTVVKQIEVNDLFEETPRIDFGLLWIFVTLLLLLLAVLLALCLCRKKRVSGEDSAAAANATYAEVNQQRQEKATRLYKDSSGENDLDNVIYATVQNHCKKKKEPNVFREDTKSLLPDDSVIYSLVTL